MSDVCVRCGEPLGDGPKQVIRNGRWRWLAHAICRRAAVHRVAMLDARTASREMTAR